AVSERRWSAAAAANPHHRPSPLPSRRTPQTLAWHWRAARVGRRAGAFCDPFAQEGRRVLGLDDVDPDPGAKLEAGRDAQLGNDFQVPVIGVADPGIG